MIFDMIRYLLDTFWVIINIFFTFDNHNHIKNSIILHKISIQLLNICKVIILDNYYKTIHQISKMQKAIKAIKSYQKTSKLYISL